MNPRRLLSAFGVAALAVTLAACAPNDPTTEAYRNATNQGYIAGDGTVAEIPEAERNEPIVFSGVSETGEAIDSKELVGNVVVVNFWFAACGPCRVEAPFLEESYQKHKDAGVAFIGINTADEAETAQAFANTYGVTYPSVIDEGDGAAKFAFAQETTLASTPVTLVLDKQGRVAARIMGAIESASILNTLVSDISDEAS